MPDPTDPLQRLTTLETTLMASANRVAAALEAPPSEDRRAHIRELWQVFDANRAAYGQTVQDLRNATTRPTSDPPLVAAQRRQMMVHGPTRASLWTAVSDMVSRQLLPGSFPPLITERTEIVRGPELGTLNYLMAVLFDLSNPVAGDRTLLPDTHYHDIPLSGAYFLNLLTAARRVLLAQNRQGPMRFLDVGCGAGSKVLAASAAFDTAHGIELNAEYVAHGQGFLTRVDADPAMISQADALTYDQYGDYDVVYFYRPLKDPALAAKMEERVLQQVRPGTVILAPLNASLGRRDDGAAKVVDRIYLAHTPRDIAADLADVAETKGCETRIIPAQSPEELGFWGPIVAQSRLNGFALP